MIGVVDLQVWLFSRGNYTVIYTLYRCKCRGDIGVEDCKTDTVGATNTSQKHSMSTIHVCVFMSERVLGVSVDRTS